MNLFELASPLEENCSHFGFSLASVPDTDGDGLPELLVGAILEDATTDTLDSGRAYLFRASAPAAATLILSSPNPEDLGRFGGDVAGVPDLNGDGFGELFVGARAEGPGASPEEAGRAYLFDGATGALLREFASPFDERRGWFGDAVVGLDDADGDGTPDLAVGAPQEDHGGSPDNAGRVHVFSGASGALLYTIASPNEELAGRFGQEIAGIHDLDGDGRGDLLVGAPGEGPGTSPRGAGRVYLFSGADGSLVREFASPGEQVDGSFGWAVASAKDLNGDGLPEIVAGATREKIDAYRTEAGRAYVFSGADGSLLRTLRSPFAQPTGWFGDEVAGVPDVNGDGLGEILVGAQRETVAGVKLAGRSFLFDGATGALLQDFVSPNSEEDGRFGSAVVGLPDVDGGAPGFGDIAVGAYREDPGTSPDLAGRVYVHRLDALLGYMPTPPPAPAGAVAIVSPPRSQVAAPGQTVVMGVEVAGEPPFVYEWYKNDVPMLGVVGPLCPMADVGPGDAAEYRVRVSNATGSATSAPGTLTVLSDGTLAGTILGGDFPLAMLPGQVFPVEATARNLGTLGWSRSQGIELRVASDPPGFAGGPLRIPGPLDVADPEGGEVGFAGSIEAPSTPGAYTLLLSLGESGAAGFGDAFAVPVEVVADGFSAALNDASLGWFGGATAGSGEVEARADGLCLTVPERGDNIVGWVGPERFVGLIDRATYRVRIHATTDRTEPDSIPRFDFVYDNYNSSGFGNAYMGELMWLDQAGGANGVGRGLSVLEAWAAPNALATAQWRGLVDPETSAFSPAADSFNDMRIVLRLLDLDSSNTLAENDSGTVCASRIEIDVVPLDAMQVESLEWGPPIGSATHAPQTYGQAAQAAGEARIDDEAATAFYRLEPAEPGARKTLLPFDADAAGESPDPYGFAPLFPVRWSGGALYRATAMIRSDVAGGEEGADPADAIFVEFDTATTELVAVHLTTRGSPPDNLWLAASPRLAETTGGAQPYVGFFHGHNATTVDPVGVPFADRFRAMVDLFNLPQIGGPESGRDPLAVEGLVVERVAIP